MSQTNYAAVLHGAKDLKMTEREIKAPAAGQVQIAIKATGLCGSDLHYYVHGRNGDFVLKEPLVPGHEAAGEVVALGDGVTAYKVGDRVAIEAGVNCKSCDYCKHGRYNLCTSMKFCSSAKVYPHVDGTLQKYLNYPVDHLHPLPDNISYEEASLVEPLSVVIHGARRAQMTAGQRVLVIGTGAVGLLGASIAAAYGATYIAGVDINQARVDFAKSEGFINDGFVLPLGERPKDAAESIARGKATSEELLKKFSPAGFDVVMECTGVESCMQMAIHCAKTGGKVLYVGMGTIAATLPFSAAMVREVDLIGVFRYCNTYPEALSLFAGGRLKNAHKLVTHRLPLKDANKAFQMMIDGKDESGKFVIKLMVGDY